MQQKRIVNIQVKPLNVSSGMKIIGEGSFQQKYSRDDNAFYPSYSSILPLMVTVAVNLQDPDGVIANGAATLDRIDWYLNEYKPANKIADNDPNYEIATVNGLLVLKVKRNTPVSEPFLLIGEAFYTNPKTGRQESRIEQQLLSTIYYEASLLSLMADSPTEVIVDPTKIDDTNPANWYVQLKAMLKSGEIDLTEDNAVYWWYVKDGKYTRLITTSDAWMVTTPNADGTYPRTITVDASRFKNLKLECRAAYKGAAASSPSSPTNAALLVQYNVRVDLPVFQNAKQIPIAGAYITVKDINTDKLIKSRCEITAGGRIIENPEKYYNITWKATNADGTSSIIGYGEYIETTVKALGITYTNPVVLEPSVMPKIGSWNVEGSVYNGIGATPAFQFGVNQIADKLGAYLVKCEDGVNVEIIGKLKNNNWMRFEDGSLAPTTVNSPEEDKGYNIMYGWIQTIHTIENVTIGSEVVALFGEEPFEYNGIQSRTIPPTLICPGLPAVVNGKFRSMYFKYRAGDGGSNGLLGITEFNKQDRTYPRTALNQLTTNDFAIAHNADPVKTIPFAPLMDWHLLNITNALMNKFGTVYLHDPNKFGGGISSNVFITSENATKTTNVGYRMNESDPWTYQRLSEQPPFCTDDKGTKRNWSAILSNEYPRMECLETQMALSYAVENNIQPDKDFSFNGYSYRYHNISGCKTLLEGEMNAVLVKFTAIPNLQAFDTAGNPITINEIRISLQTSAVYGMDLVSADVFQYAGAGIEKVATIQEDGRHLTKVFICLDQPNLTLDKTAEKTSGDFDFESAYDQAGAYTMSNSGYFTDLIRGTRVGTTKKGGLSDNTCYMDTGNGIGVSPIGKKVRIGHRVRGLGSWGVCSARYLLATFPLSTPYASYAGGFQVRLPEGTSSATAQNASGESAAVSE
nr:MAG TPA: hypothetical protein [Caudoviricetes sp.]